MCSDPAQIAFAVLSVAVPLILAVWQGWVHREGLPGFRPREDITLRPHDARHDHVAETPQVGGDVAVTIEGRLQQLEGRVDTVMADLRDERVQRQRGDRETMRQAQDAVREVDTRIARHEGGHRADEHQDHQHGALVAVFSAVAGLSAAFNVGGSYLCQ